MTTINHVCIRVLDLERSVAFYREALGLTPVRELTIEDRGWQLVFLGDGETGFQLELCKEMGRTQPYALGDDCPHVALISRNFAALKQTHRDAGQIVDEMPSGIYFLRDPDGHLLEILPPKD